MVPYISYSRTLKNTGIFGHTGKQYVLNINIDNVYTLWYTTRRLDDNVFLFFFLSKKQKQNESQTVVRWRHVEGERSIRISGIYLSIYFLSLYFSFRCGFWKHRNSYPRCEQSFPVFVFLFLLVEIDGEGENIRQQQRCGRRVGDCNNIRPFSVCGPLRGSHRCFLFPM